MESQKKITRVYIVITLVFLALLGTALLFALPSFAPPDRVAKKSGTLTVTASFYPLYYFASRIGGDKADVVNITPTSAEPHDYELTAQDVARIETSDILVLNGGGFEAWGESMQKNVNAGTAVVVAGEGLATAQVMEEGRMIADPHVWLSPPLVKQIVQRIVDAYRKADPIDAAYFQMNAARISDDLDALDAAYRSGLATCVKKEIITSHAAFGYLASTYGLHQVPIAGLSPDAEPSPKQLADIAAFARKNDVHYIFFESLVSPKLSDTIAGEIGAKTLVLSPIEGLTAEEVAASDDYFSVMKSDLTHLRTALECAN